MQSSDNSYDDSVDSNEFLLVIYDETFVMIDVFSVRNAVLPRANFRSEHTRFALFLRDGEQSWIPGKRHDNLTHCDVAIKTTRMLIVVKSFDVRFIY